MEFGRMESGARDGARAVQARPRHPAAVAGSDFAASCLAGDALSATMTTAEWLREDAKRIVVAGERVRNAHDARDARGEIDRLLGYAGDVDHIRRTEIEQYPPASYARKMLTQRLNDYAAALDPLRSRERQVAHLQANITRLEGIREKIRALPPERFTSIALKRQIDEEHASLEPLVHAVKGGRFDAVPYLVHLGVKKLDEINALEQHVVTATEKEAQIFDHAAGPVYHAPDLDGLPLHFVQFRNDDNCALYAANAALHSLGEPLIDLPLVHAHQDAIATPEWVGASDVPLSERRRPSSHELSAIISGAPDIDLERETISDPLAVMRANHPGVKSTAVMAHQAEIMRSARALLVLAGDHWTAIVRRPDDAWTFVDSLNPRSQDAVYRQPTALDALTEHANRGYGVENVIALL